MTVKSSCSDTQLLEEIWADRWQALSDMLNSFVGTPSHYEGLAVPRWGTLRPVVERLQAFAPRQYDYFRNGFSDGTLLTSTQVPPDRAYAAVLIQTGNDLDVIQSVILQHLSGAPLETALLREADQLAMFALLPAIALGLLADEEPTVLTYFQKTSIVRVVPYAPVALIGIPFTALRTSSDLLATAHEVGHYVFWHAKVPTGEGSPVKAYLHEVLRNEAEAANLPRWCLAWLEETFADIYGCLIFGPAMVVASQEMQRSRTEHEFRDSDNDHPVPRLRPSIYHKVLQQSTNPERKAWVEKLARRWKTIVNSKGLMDVSAFTVPGVKHIDTDVLVGQATDEDNFTLDTAKPIDKLIDLILRHLSGIEDYWPQRLPYPPLPPLEPDNDDVTLCALYQWFETVRADVLTKITVPDVLPVVQLDTLWYEWFKEHGFDQLVTPMDLKKWGFILEAGGWTSEPINWPLP